MSKTIENPDMRFWWLTQDNTFEEVNLMLYTSPNNPLTFKLGDNVKQKFLSHGFDHNRPTKIFAHGFTDSGSNYCPPFINAYAASGWDVNLICIDWSAYADFDWPIYVRAAENAVKVGKVVGQKVVSKLLIKKLKQNPKLIHAIGHSLGAHVVGNIGKYSGQKIGRITGLDPARVYFENWAHVHERLLRTDADFVDVIHTNSGHIHEGCLTMDWNVGHVDFFPNGGKHMPGCTDKHPSFWEMHWDFYQTVAGLMSTQCSHGRANSYYAESIEHRKDARTYFASQRCAGYQNQCDPNDQLPMGENLRAEM